MKIEFKSEAICDLCGRQLTVESEDHRILSNTQRIVIVYRIRPCHNCGKVNQITNENGGTYTRQ